MSSPNGPFRIVEHVIPGQHIRQYPQATATEQEETLYLAVKQYIPLDNQNPKPRDVTIIAAHANGFPKELYEPLWEELHARSKSQGFRIRSIWMADVAHQGQSGVFNENALGNDPSWFDHPRDLLHFINLKRDEMPRPLIGIGHSFGGAQLVTLSLIHPRLFHSLVLLDPVIQRQSTQTPPAIPLTRHSNTTNSTTQGPRSEERWVPMNTILSTYRRDIWPSRQAAAKSFKRSPFYQTWDPRVLDQWIRYGLRELPTAIHPHPTDRQSGHNGDRPVTLTTTPHQEVFTFSRPNYDFDPVTNKPANTWTHPDLDPHGPNTYPFYRYEPSFIFFQLPHLRPSVLYVFGGKSDMCIPEMCEDKMRTTGTGIGGSGGVKAGRVKSVLFEDKGHLLAQEAVSECADAAAGFLATELQRYQIEDEAFRVQWSQKSKREKSTVDERWLKEVGPPAARPPKGSNTGSKLKL